MSENELILFLETPRASGGRGHRWLVPASSQLVTETEITGWTRKLEESEQPDDILVVRRPVGQIVGGNTRDALEVLVVANLPQLDPDQRKMANSVLERFLDRFDPDRVNWEQGSGLVVPTPELNSLYSELRETLPVPPDRKPTRPTPTPTLPNPNPNPENDSRRPKATRSMRRILAGAAAAIFFSWVAFSLLSGIGDTGEKVEDDPIWNSFLTFREESLSETAARESSPIEDARFLWENLKVSKWADGDFLRTDLTRNLTEATLFFKLETPERWYLDAAYDRSRAAGELRAILKAIGGSLESEEVPLDGKFVEAIAESSDALDSADWGELDPKISGDLERSKKDLRDIPANTRLDWPTPADGERARVILKTIEILSSEDPSERGIQNWKDLFTDEVTALASERNDPVAVIQWQLMKPLDAWAQSIP